MEYARLIMSGQGVKDSLYAQPHSEVAGFSFDEQVAAVFADMIERSVPGYASVLSLCGMLVERFACDETSLYDLGCSLGATSFAMARAAQANKLNCNIIAVDNSDAMLAEARHLLVGQAAASAIEWRCEDLQTLAVRNASIVAMNFTLQFIPVEQRPALLRSIAAGLNPGGVLVLSEKIQLDDEGLDKLFIELHHDFKRSNGYSELEVSQKREALENVLVPESLAVHRQRLMESGFQRVELWFQCLNFASLLAFK